jgi:manganese transport protein
VATNGCLRGPGYLVAVGYMDPGNWATSLAGGSKFGYALLVVALLVQPDGDRAAIALRAACHRLGPRSRAGLPRCLSARRSPSALGFAEIAIIATDIAEVIGTAIGLNLLFGIPLESAC